MPGDKLYAVRIVRDDPDKGLNFTVPFHVGGKATPYEFCIRLFQWIGHRTFRLALLLDDQGFLIENYRPGTGWYKSGREEPVA